MPAEMRTEDVNPVDLRQTAEGVADLEKADARVPVSLAVTNSNVDSPPTDAQIRAVLGQRELGDTFIIRDGTGAAKLWLIIRGGNDTWYHGTLTKAV